MPTTGTLYFGSTRLGNPDSLWDVMTATVGSTSVDLSWPTAGGTPSSYEISIDGTAIDVGNVTSYTASGLTAGNSYEFKVRPIYADGTIGGWSYQKARTPHGLNVASGGTETTISNYNGTGQTWKLHTFTSNGTLTVTAGTQPFHVLFVAGGGGSGNQISGYTGGGGGAGGYFQSTTQTISSSLVCTIGSGASAGNGYAGGNTTVTIDGGTPIVCGGGANGYGGAYGHGPGTPGTGSNGGSNGGSGGDPYRPGASGGCGQTFNRTFNGVTYSQCGTGTRGSSAGPGGGSGTGGVVLVAYQMP